MYNVRESWTDERLDDFRGEVNRRFDEMGGRLDRIEDRIDDLYRIMLRLGGGAIVTFVVGFAGMIATQL